MVFCVRWKREMIVFSRNTIQNGVGISRIFAASDSGRGSCEKVGRCAVAEEGVWEGLPSLGCGVLPRENFGKYRCKSVQFGALWGHQVMKSETANRRFSAPLLKVGRNLPSLPYRFRGPWLG